MSDLEVLRADSGHLATAFHHELGRSNSSFLLDDVLTLEDVNTLRTGSGSRAMESTATAYVVVRNPAAVGEKIRSHEVDILTTHEETSQDAWLVASPSGTEESTGGQYGKAFCVTDLSPLKLLPLGASPCQSSRSTLPGQPSKSLCSPASPQSKGPISKQGATQEATSKLRGSFNFARGGFSDASGPSPRIAQPSALKKPAGRAGTLALPASPASSLPVRGDAAQQHVVLPKLTIPADPNPLRTSQIASPSSQRQPGSPLHPGSGPGFPAPNKLPRVALRGASSLQTGGIGRGRLAKVGALPSPSSLSASRIPKPSGEKCGPWTPCLVTRTPRPGSAAAGPFGSAGHTTIGDIRPTAPLDEDASSESSAHQAGGPALAVPDLEPSAESSLHAIQAASLPGATHDAETPSQPESTPEEPDTSSAPASQVTGTIHSEESSGSTGPTLPDTTAPPLECPASPSISLQQSPSLLPRSPLRRSAKTPAQIAAANEWAAQGRLGGSRGNSDEAEVRFPPSRIPHSPLRASVPTPLPAPSVAAEDSALELVGGVPVPDHKEVDAKEGGDSGVGDKGKANALNLSAVGGGAEKAAACNLPEPPPQVLSLSAVQRRLPRVRVRDADQEKEKASCASCSIM